MKRITFLLKQLKTRVGLAPVALCAFTVAMFGLYMWQLSVSTASGYEMRSVEKEIADLQGTIAGQQARISHLESIDSVSGRIQLLGFSKATEVAYVFTGSDNVAVR